MRRSASGAVLWLLIVASRGHAAEASRAIPADFCVKVELREATSGAVAVAEMVAYRGRILEVIDGRHEIILIDPLARRVEVINLDRKQVARISFDRLDAESKVYRARLEKTVDTLSASERRADKLNAAKTADLIADDLPMNFDASTNSLRRKNSTVELDVRGVPDPDVARLALIREALTYLIKLDTYRAPDKIPPFVQLQAIDALTDRHHLRPAQMSFLYRLNGPPVRFVWKYELSPGVSEEDVELWTKLQHFLTLAAVLEFDTYESGLHPRPRKLSAPAGR